MDSLLCLLGNDAEEILDHIRRRLKSDRRHRQCQKPEFIVENIKFSLDFRKQNGGHTFNWLRTGGLVAGRKDERNMAEKNLANRLERLTTNKM